jgi:hypothetical protein
MLSRKTGPEIISSKVTTLSISWLNHQVVAKNVRRGVIEGTWETELAAEGDPDLAGLIREAVRQTHYDGTTVSLLLANSRLAQNLVDVPPVFGSALTKIIQLEAQQQKVFAGEAAWTFQTALTTADNKRAVLHLLPKPLLDQLVQAGLQNELYLTSVVPVSAVLHQQLTLLPLNKGDVALLAAETGGSTTVVAARADGQLLLVRTLLGNWNENAERMALDLKRTLSFITQQFELTVNAGVWLFGPGAAEQSPVLAAQLDHPVTVSPVEYRPDYWAIEAVKLSPAQCPNFIERKLQNAPQRRKFAWVVVVTTALLVLVSVAVAVLLNRQARQEEANADRLSKRIVELQTQRTSLDQRNAELARKEQMIKLVLDDRPPPAPVWFMGYLSEVLPAELVVTNLQVNRATNAWKVRLAGNLQTTGQPPGPTTLTNAVGVLADRLANGPFHLKILQRSDQPDSSAAGDSRTGRYNGKGVAENSFGIEGVMK